jgi:hypothetical protein
MADWLATWFGPSLISATALACSAYISFRQREAAWYKEFRELYEEFWAEDDMAHVRAWIACDDAYQEVKALLEQRKNGGVTKEDYKYLDKIDKFCALMLRIIDMDARPTTKRQRKLWQDLYFNFWVDKMSEREELATYVRKYWDRIPMPIPRQYRKLPKSSNRHLLPTE